MSEKETMASNLRQKDRIDYKALNDSGQVILKPSSLDNIQSNDIANQGNDKKSDTYSTSSANENSNDLTELTEMSNQLNDLDLSKPITKKMNQHPVSDLKYLKSNYDVLKEEIEDYIDENPTNHTIVSIDDIETCEPTNLI